MADDPDKKPGKPNDYVQAESILQLALAVPAGAFVGLGIGYLLDKHFHTGWIAITRMTSAAERRPMTDPFVADVTTMC